MAMCSKCDNCSTCNHLHIINKNKVYAVCDERLAIFVINDTRMTICNKWEANEARKKGGLASLR